MLNRATVAAFFVTLMSAFAVAGASAAPPTDFWLNKHFMNMAHQGGELEAPGNTLFAFKSAIAERGADTLEMDGYLTEDGVFVITHDLDPYKTSNAPGAAGGQERIDHQISNLTLDELKQYDFAYKFRPGTGHYGYPHGDAPAEEYIYRGIATGEKLPPAGYTANDFRIATFREVLDAFPDTPINVDMKAPGNNPGLSIAAAEAVAEIMEDYPERSEDVIVASFYQPALVAFHDANPDHKALSAGEDGQIAYFANQPIVPTPVALQPPDWIFFSGVWLEPAKIFKTKPDIDDYAIHVWPNDHDPDQETPSYYREQIAIGINGLFTQVPSELHEFLCAEGIPRPDGSLRCPQQQCPEGQEGLAPNCQHGDCPDGMVGMPPNCEYEACPEGKVGTPPNCLDKGRPPCGRGDGPYPECRPSYRIAVSISPKKGKIKAGKSTRLKVKITNLGSSGKFAVKLKSNNRQIKLPKSIAVSLANNRSAVKTITVKATRKAKGKATITASYKKFTAKSVLTVKKAVKKKRKKKALR